MRKLAFLALRLTLLPLVFREVFQRNKVTILVYHAPTPQAFDAQIGVLRRLYNIVPLSAYVEARRTGDFSKLPPKALVVTLDDGHRSNFALKKVLERQNVPITIFLCSGLIGTRRRFWFLHEMSPALVQQLKTVPDNERLATLRRTGFEEAKEFDDRQVLSIAELRQLNTKADFQSHTVFHPVLPRCSEEKAEAEIAGSRSDLQTKLGHEVYALAYPNGDYSERELRLAERAGYSCALSTDRGFNSKKTPLFRLRRICVPDDADQHELLVKASGLWGEIKAALDASRRRVHDTGAQR
ncbi:polysaccharide deacetylase family protein [Bradyrhizobium genosp. A]|uniref:polysaccharide deacetylase family protein n=1 Tax=Bradyrhizobium genosp. A TaxID=83626 RepID=UPI003CE6BEB1